LCNTFSGKPTQLCIVIINQYKLQKRSGIMSKIIGVLETKNKSFAINIGERKLKINNSFNSLKNKIMKKFIFLISMVGMAFLLNSCSAGYVTEEPVYQTYNRPQQPSNDYIWIEGGWNWNSGTRTYRQVNGTWQRHDNGRRHRHGHWERNEHGSRWID
jgi:hypothetical protein